MSGSSLFLAGLATIFLVATPATLHAQFKYSTPPDPKRPDYTAAPLQDWEKKFRDFKFFTYDQGSHVLPYRYYQPAKLEPGKKYPLVVFFHGYGERGADNRLQLFRFHETVDFWEKYPCFILAPQCFTREGPAPSDGQDRWVNTSFGAKSHTMATEPTWPFRMAMELIDETISRFPVDPKRVYVTGLSMGGFATWEILQREGERFAAAVPVCGGADVAFAKKLASIPLWITHGGADPTVPPSRSRDMVAALKAAGGDPKYTEFPGVGHDAWAPTYSNPEIWDWLFHQSQK